MVDGLLNVFFEAVGHRVAERGIYIGFVLVMALACLRGSDLQRSSELNLSNDAL